MKWKCTEPRSYYKKYQSVPIKNHQNWFEVYKLPGDVFGICEPQHFQEVNAYLIIGDKEALLLDTGMGIADISLVVKELYSGPITVINTHYHFDHIGNNYKFPKVYAHINPLVTAIAEKGLPKEGLGNQLDEGMFLFDYPEGFSPNSFKILPYTVTDLFEGQTFDLGGRILEVIFTPGHSEDCIMLYDRQHRILFTGDTFYLGALYLHFNCKEFGTSDINDYCASIKKLLSEFPEVSSLYSSHNDFIVNPCKLRETAAALNEIIENKICENTAPNDGHTYLEDGKSLIEYKFDGFSVVIQVD